MGELSVILGLSQIIQKDVDVQVCVCILSWREFIQKL